MPKTSVANKPRIAITMGDPCGVGPELVVKALSSPSVMDACQPIIIGDHAVVLRALDLIGSDFRLQEVSALEARLVGGPHQAVAVLSPAPLTRDDISYGHPSPAACRATVAYIDFAVRLALDGKVDGICTGPIHKANLQRQGFSFPGHTEYLQHLTGAGHVVMMLAGPRLRVSLVTIHHGLFELPGLLTGPLIQQAIALTGQALCRDFALPAPRIAVAALNPHAGEEGRFGTEEKHLIQPVLETFREDMFSVFGPFPPDTVFRRAFEGEFDAVVAMYHDQGLIPIKLVHFHDAVNVTLGLPIIRTAVDHGTAYDLAGTGRAHPGSLSAAIRLSARMARNRNMSSHP